MTISIAAVAVLVAAVGWWSVAGIAGVLAFGTFVAVFVLVRRALEPWEQGE